MFDIKPLEGQEIAAGTLLCSLLVLRLPQEMRLRDSGFALYGTLIDCHLCYLQCLLYKQASHPSQNHPLRRAPPRHGPQSALIGTEEGRLFASNCLPRVILMMLMGTKLPPKRP